MKLKGRVIKGAGRGKALGFPTANLDRETDTEEGIYVGYVSPSTGSGTNFVPERSRRPCLIFIGAAETFGETNKRVEVYILDWSGDLYGHELEIEILRKLRNNMKFETKEALVEQMKQDEKQARDLLFNSPPHEEGKGRSR